MITYKIYSISVCGEIIYVGRTKKKIRRRLRDHKQSAKRGANIPICVFLRLYLSAWESVCIEEIDCCFDYEESKKLEAYWIHQFACWNFKLKNVVHVTCKSSYVWKKGSPQKNIKISKKNRIANGESIKKGYVKRAEPFKYISKSDGGRYFYSTNKLAKYSFTKKELSSIRRKYKKGDCDKLAIICDKTNETIRTCINGSKGLVRVEIYNEIKKYYNLKTIT